MEVTSKDDIVLNDAPIFSISLLKDFINKQEIPLADEDEESLIADTTDMLRVANVIDKNENKIWVQYSYKYEIE